MNQPQDELHAWLALAGGGMAARQRARRLLAHFGGPLEVFQAGPGEAREVLAGEDAAGIFEALAPMAPVAARTRQWLNSSPLHHVLPLGDERYPAALLESPDPPLVIHCHGQLESLNRSAVAVVGSRHATPAGLKIAGRLSAELSVLGIEIVSGLAVGIDAAAHEAALQAGGGASTIAVVACGLDDVYPRQHRALFERIAECGLVVSEHPLNTAALPAFFPQRNRIIAGLSRSVIVVEATVRSGSLITARLASEAGRDVFAVPGHLSSPQAAGCNQLIKGGAGLLEHVGDLLESQPWAFSAAARQAVRPEPRRSSGSRRRPGAGGHLGAMRARVPADAPAPPSPGSAALPPTDSNPELQTESWFRARRLLKARPCDLAELAEAASGTPSDMSRTLLLAELDGCVARLPGGLYQWCGSPRDTG